MNPSSSPFPVHETTVATMLPDGRTVKTTEQRHSDGSRTVVRETIATDGKRTVDTTELPPITLESTMAENAEPLAGRIALRCEAYDTLAVLSTLVFGFAAAVLSEDLKESEADQSISRQLTVLFGALATASSMYATVSFVSDSYFARQLLALNTEDGAQEAANYLLDGNGCTTNQNRRQFGIHLAFLSLMFSGIRVIASACATLEEDRGNAWLVIVVAAVMGMATVFTIVDWTLDCRDFNKSKTENDKKNHSNQSRTDIHRTIPHIIPMAQSPYA